MGRILFIGRGWVRLAACARPSRGGGEPEPGIGMGGNMRKHNLGGDMCMHYSGGCGLWHVLPCGPGCGEAGESKQAGLPQQIPQAWAAGKHAANV